MMMKAFDWFVVLCVAAVIVVCCVVLVKAQESTTTVYEYNGWQNKTTLRSHTWNAADRPPQPNERLYIYKDGIKQDGYYQWNGSDWQPRNGAFIGGGSDGLDKSSEKEDDYLVID